MTTDVEPFPVGRFAHALANWADSPWFFPIVLAATVAGLFYDAVGPDCVFAFRDSLHFYPPLYRLVADEWLSGRVPLWNPLVNCGQPLAGMGTSGAFYPPQILLTMLLPDGVSLNVYCILHLAFAATGAYLLARQQACSRPAATVAGLAYAFCGSVLLQIYNPIYAAGAAWLVWAVYAGMRLLDGGGLRNLPLLGSALAMSVFCGDPQSAYHAGLVLGACWLMQPGRTWRGLGLLAAGGLLGGLLSFVQVALAAEFARESTRAMHIVPFSIWDVPAFLRRSADVRQGVAWYDVLIGRPPIGADHYHATYRFPVAWHRLGELLWPGLSGPTNARWTVQSGLARADWWTASIYTGIFPLVAATVAVTNPRLRRLHGFWLLLGGFALLASTGDVGIAAVVRWCREALGGHAVSMSYRPGDELGSAYWLLTSFAPGYAGFRYPAKWMTVFALALGQVAAQMIDALRDKPSRQQASRIAIGITVLSSAGVVCLLIAAARVGPGYVLPWSAHARGRDLAFWSVCAGGIQAAMVCGGLVWIGRRSWPRGARAVAVAALTAADLGVAGRYELLVVPWSMVVESSSYLGGMAESRRPDPAAGRTRVRIRKSAALSTMAPVTKPEQRAATELLRAGVAQIGQMASGNIAWLHGCELIGEPSTAMDRDLDALRLNRHRGGEAIAPRRFLDAAGVQFFLAANLQDDEDNAPSILNNWSPRQLTGDFEGDMPLGAPMPRLAIPVDRPPDGDPLLFVCRNESVLPRARIVHDIAVVPPVDAAERDRWLGLLERVAFPTRDVPDLRRAAIVEAMPDGSPVFPQLADRPRQPVKDACRIVVDEPQRVVIEASLAEPGLVYLADTFHRDWQAAASSDDGPWRPVPVLRANRVHRGVGLPAGRHQIEYRYRSRTFARTAPITLMAWGGTAAALLWSFRRGRPTERRRRA